MYNNVQCTLLILNKRDQRILSIIYKTAKYINIKTLSESLIKLGQVLGNVVQFLIIDRTARLR